MWSVSNLGRGLVECVGSAPDYGVLACCLHPAKILPRGECEIDYIPVSLVRITPVCLARLKHECVITRVIRVTSLCSDYVYVARYMYALDRFALTRSRDQKHLSPSKTRAGDNVARVVLRLLCLPATSLRDIFAPVRRREIARRIFE